MGTYAEIKRCVDRALVVEATQLAFHHKMWPYWWRRVRLACPKCDGYVVHKRQKNGQAFAFCSELCGGYMHNEDFLTYKRTIVRALTREEAVPEIWPYVLVEPVTRVDVAS